MRPSRVSVVTQSCPNCQRVHDISVYVTGQKLTCSCGIRFEVQRKDVTPVPAGSAKSAVTVDLQLSQGTGPTVSPPSRNEGERVDPADPSSTVVRIAPPELPGYELLEMLGRGGMGEVWRARQKSLDRVVALKLLPPKLAADKEFVARFDKEVTALAALSHPNITQIIDRGNVGNHFYFAMELVEGRTLRELMNERRPSPAESLKICLQICHAMEAAHEKKIVHRDLKPENILLDARGSAKVADFGLAGMRGAEKDLSLTATAVAMGTVNYMAPEQRRDAKNVDHRADIYSLGVLLYELLTGELPIGRFRLPSERVSGLDRSIDTVVSQALENEPDARQQSAVELSAQLEPLIARASTQSAKGIDTSPQRPKNAKAAAGAPPSMLDKSWSGFKVGLMVVGALAIGAVLLKSLPEEEKPQPARRAPQWYSDTEDTLTTGLPLAKDGAFALDFDPAVEGQGPSQDINAHSGQWRLEDGALTALQFGLPTLSDQPLLRPRAYVSSRYYSADDFTAEVDMQIEELPEGFPPVDASAQRFSELSFRIKDTQVSALVIPGVGVRLGWKYFTVDGAEVSNNSARDVENFIEDESQVPLGRFRVKLKLTKGKNGAVDAEAFVNGARFIHKVLPGLSGQVAKVALGCRNLSCRYDDLSVSGKPAQKPAPKEGSEP